MNFHLARLCQIALVFVLLSGPAYAVFPDCIFIAGGDSWETSAPPEWRSNLMAHNCARRQVSPAATTPIQPLTWNPSIAAQAQTYSAQCIWAHSGASGLGENLSAVAPWSDQHLVPVIGWASENVNYNYATNSCAAGQQCGHYTQMVWANSTQLGCGTANCSENTPFGPQFPQWTITVCNYSPPGNFIGQRPY